MVWIVVLAGVAALLAMAWWMDSRRRGGAPRGPSEPDSSVYDRYHSGNAGPGDFYGGPGGS